MRSVISKSNVFARQINGKASLVARALPSVYPAVSFPLQSKFACASAVRHFSSTSGLNEILAEEVKHETTKDEEVDQEFLDSTQVVESLGFVMTDEPGTGIVKLTRTYKGETIEVKWDCQNESEESEGYDLNQLSETDATPAENDETVDEGLDFGINFEVCIKKGDNKLLFDCVSSQKMKIQNVQFFPPGVEVNDETVYGGPRFDELDEKVQESFYDYLSERGVDNEVSFFILSKSALKEQAEYANWLNKIVAFTS